MSIKKWDNGTSKWDDGVTFWDRLVYAVASAFARRTTFTSMFARKTNDQPTDFPRKT